MQYSSEALLQFTPAQLLPELVNRKPITTISITTLYPTSRNRCDEISFRTGILTVDFKPVYRIEVAPPS